MPGAAAKSAAARERGEAVAATAPATAAAKGGLAGPVAGAPAELEWERGGGGGGREC